MRLIATVFLLAALSFSSTTISACHADDINDVLNNMQDTFLTLGQGFEEEIKQCAAECGLDESCTTECSVDENCLMNCIHDLMMGILRSMLGVSSEEMELMVACQVYSSSISSCQQEMLNYWQSINASFDPHKLENDCKLLCDKASDRITCRAKCVSNFKDHIISNGYKKFTSCVKEAIPSDSPCWASIHLPEIK